MAQPPRQGGRLDAPLVWERGGGASVAAAFRRGRSPRVRWRLWLGTLADLGAILAVAGLVLAVAAERGASLSPGQLLLGAACSLLVAGTGGTASLWAWRASPGMVLTGVCFATAVPLSRALWSWLVWIVCLPLLGIPLLLGRQGGMVAERLLGARLSRRSPRGDV